MGPELGSRCNVQRFLRTPSFLSSSFLPVNWSVDCVPKSKTPYSEGLRNSLTSGRSFACTVLDRSAIRECMRPRLPGTEPAAAAAVGEINPVCAQWTSAKTRPYMRGQPMTCYKHHERDVYTCVNHLNCAPYITGVDRRLRTMVRKHDGVAISRGFIRLPRPGRSQQGDLCETSSVYPRCGMGNA